MEMTVDPELLLLIDWTLHNVLDIVKHDIKQTCSTKELHICEIQQCLDGTNISIKMYITDLPKIILEGAQTSNVSFL